MSKGKQGSLLEYDPDAQPTDDKTITVCHVDEKTDFYGGRGRRSTHIGQKQPMKNGWLGNPYRLADGHTREEAIEKFEERFIKELRDSKRLTNAVVALPGCRVACHCRHSNEQEPACHLDVVKEKLLDGTVFCIAQEIHDIPICNWKQEVACDWENLV